MAPLMYAVLGAAGLGGLIWLTKKHPLDPKSLPLVDPKNSPGLVSELDKGRSYAVTYMVDLSKAPVVKTAQAAVELTKMYFGGEGFNLRSEPKPVNAQEAAKFNAGQPSAWTFVGQWTKDGKAMQTPNPVFPTAQFFLLPIA